MQTRIWISNNLKTAWQLTKGPQWAMWFVLIVWVLSLLLCLIPPLSFILIAAWFGPLFTGMNMIALKRARGVNITLKTGFQYFDLSQPLIAIGIGFLSIVVISVGIAFGFYWLLNSFIPHSSFNFHMIVIFCTLVFTLIYTLLAFTPCFIVDKAMPPWRALQQSFLTIYANGMRLFGLMTILYLFNLINFWLGKIPHAGIFIYFAISLWLIPFTFFNLAVAYHQLID